MDTLDGMGYQLFDSGPGGALIGTYLAVQEDTVAGEITFFFKNTNAGGVNGSGNALSVTLTDITFD